MNLLLGILVPLIRRFAVGAILGRIGSTLVGPRNSRPGTADASANALDAPVAPDGAQPPPAVSGKERH